MEKAVAVKLEVEQVDPYNYLFRFPGTREGAILFVANLYTLEHTDIPPIKVGRVRFHSDDTGFGTREWRAYQANEAQSALDTIFRMQKEVEDGLPTAAV